MMGIYIRNDLQMDRVGMMIPAPNYDSHTSQDPENDKKDSQ